MTETVGRKNVCAICGLSLTMLFDDVTFNNSRLKEQKEFRKPNQEFSFKLRYTCSFCGKVFVEKKLKLKGK